VVEVGLVLGLLGRVVVLQVVAVVALVFGDVRVVVGLVGLGLLGDYFFEHLHGLAAVLGGEFGLGFFDELGLGLLAYDYGLLEFGLFFGLLLLLRRLGDLSSDSEVVWFVYLLEDLLLLLEQFGFLVASFTLVLVCGQVLGTAWVDKALIITIC
jgi:hypothetical protein